MRNLSIHHTDDAAPTDALPAAGGVEHNTRTLGRIQNRSPFLHGTRRPIGSKSTSKRGCTLARSVELLQGEGFARFEHDKFIIPRTEERFFHQRIGTFDFLVA